MIDAYIQQCREKAGVETNYKLSKILGIDERLLNLYEKCERMPDVYACFVISRYLGMDTEKLIIEVEAKTEKNELKRLYFWNAQRVSDKITANVYHISIFVILIAALLLLGDSTGDNWIISLISVIITSLYYRLKD